MTTQDKKLVTGDIMTTILRVKNCVNKVTYVVSGRLEPRPVCLLTIMLQYHLLAQSLEIFFGSQDKIFSSQDMGWISCQHSSKGCTSPWGSHDCRPLSLKRLHPRSTTQERKRLSTPGVLKFGYPLSPLERALKNTDPWAAPPETVI